jgi:hypothetical protein
MHNNSKRFRILYIFGSVTILFVFLGCGKIELKRQILEGGSASSNFISKKNHQKELKKTNLVYFGKWTTSSTAENFYHLTYQVTEEESADNKRMMILRISDLSGKEIFKEEFNTLYSIYARELLYQDTGEQLLIRYNPGGSGTELKILTFVNGKVENIVEDESIHNENGEFLFLPSSVNRSQPEQPIQIFEIGGDKISGENRKIVKVYRYQNNKYRLYTSVFYEDILSKINNTLEQDGFKID